MVLGSKWNEDMLTVTAPSGATSAGCVVAERPAALAVLDALGVAATWLGPWEGGADVGALQAASVTLHATARVSAALEIAIRGSLSRDLPSTRRARHEPPSSAEPGCESSGSRSGRVSKRVARRWARLAQPPVST